MLFPTITFAIFFMIVLPSSWLLMPRARAAGSSSCSRRATSSTATGTGASSSCSPRRPSSTSSSPARSTAATCERTRRALLAGAVAVNLALLGYFKYYGLLRPVVATTSLDRHRARRSATPSSPSPCRSASRSSRSRRSATSSTSTAATFEPGPLLDFAVYLSFFPHLVAGPIVRAARVHAAARGAPRPAPHRREPRVLPDLHRAVQEGRDRELPRDRDRRRRVRVAEPALVARDARRRSTPTRSRSTPTSAATPTWRSGIALLLGLPLPAELRRPVHRDVAPGLLAALAHDAVALAARLPLHPARRQPRRHAAARTATS